MANNNKDYSKNIKEMMDENPLLKQGAFFGFYLIFFFIIILLLRTSYQSSSKKVDIKKTGYDYDFTLTKILNENYHFSFHETNNDITTIYEGDWLDKEISYKKSGSISTEYYFDGTQMYQKDANTLLWNKIPESPSFYNIVKPRILDKIIRQANYISKTEYISSNQKSYIYQINNKKLSRIMDTDKSNQTTTEQETNEEQEENLLNTIQVNLNDNKISNIELDLTNYYKMINNTPTNYKLVLSYSKYGEIKELVGPFATN